ncbi:MAG: hypothetical protein CMJ78_26525 [Planctomycetaceae bacterium]|nr:hypothetical protein [Planctomycetaceae bacterium]
MTLNVKLFARAADIAGESSVELELPDDSSVGDLRAALVHRFPEMQPLVASLLVAIGTDYADDTTTIPANANVACFPPVSGG